MVTVIRMLSQVILMDVFEIKSPPKLSIEKQKKFVL